VSILLDREWSSKVKKSVLGNRYKDGIKPHYERYSLPNLASTMADHFHKNSERAPAIMDETVKEVLDDSETVVFFLLDGFGDKLVQTLQKDEYLKSMLQSSHYAPITTTFPSTTTTALASANTGLFPEQHGIIGHTMYLKKLGVIASLISFSPVAELHKGTLLASGIEPRELINGSTIYEELRDDGIESAVLTKNAYRSSGLTRMIHAGAEIITYNVASDMITQLRKIIEAQKHRFIFAYWDAMDIAAHTYGAGEDEVLAEVRSFFYVLQTELFKKINRKTAKKTSYFMTGDHGHITVKSSRRIIANDYPEFVKNIQIMPAGDSRASFIKTTADGDLKVRKFFAGFKGKIDLIAADKAVHDGLFGRGMMVKDVREALGDYLVLSKQDYAFIYKYRKREEIGLIGYHGGLHQDEMLVPMIFGHFS